jgi:Zn-dependent protease
VLLLSGFDLTRIALLTLAFIIAIAVHEGNHALVATALGDDTPRRHGRLTLNPLKHVDKAGIIVFLIAGFGWGWTPVNPQNLRPNPRLGNAIVAAAGPLANLGLAVIFTLLWRSEALTATLGGTELARIAHQFFFLAALMNLILFVFNLIPIPPLDGFSVLVGLVPRDLALTLRRLEPYGLPLMLALFLLPSMLGFSVISVLLRPVLRVFGLGGF